MEHTVEIVDENIDDADYDVLDADLVGITAMTPLAPRAYRIADLFCQRKIPVIMGGVHPTMLPDEASQHCSTVVVGEADSVWPAVVEDACEGTLKKRYEEAPDLTNLPFPRWDLLRRDRYFTTNLSQTTRGCDIDCDFCSVSAFFHSQCKNRPVGDVIEEVSNHQGKHIFFVDDNIAASRQYAKELFKALTPLSKHWYSQCSLTIAHDEELLRLAAESGCRGLFVGFESLAEESIREVHKINLVNKYREYINKMHDVGISIEGAFIFGFDNDDKYVFRKTVDFCQENELDAIQFSILTPFPGTRLFNRLHREGRILTYEWEKYDAAHVVYRPKQMSVEQLYDGFFDAYRSFYSVRSITSRFFTTRLPRMLYLIINRGFRKSSKQLEKRVTLARQRSG